MRSSIFANTFACTCAYIEVTHFTIVNIACWKNNSQLLDACNLNLSCGIRVRSCILLFWPLGKLELMSLPVCFIHVRMWVCSYMYMNLRTLCQLCQNNDCFPFSVLQITSVLFLKKLIEKKTDLLPHKQHLWISGNYGEVTVCVCVCVRVLNLSLDV